MPKGLGPAVAPPPDLELVDGPLAPGSRALVQFDPMLGEPPDENRPSPDTGAHGASEGWPGTREQMREQIQNIE